MITRKPTVLKIAPSVMQSMNHLVQIFFQFFFRDFFRRCVFALGCRCRPPELSARLSRSSSSSSSPAVESFSTSRSSRGIDWYFLLEKPLPCLGKVDSSSSCHL